MTALAWLVPCALALGGLGLGAFLWSLRSGQFDDLEGAGWRALEDGAPGDDEPRRPIKDHTAAELVRAARQRQ